MAKVYIVKGIEPYECDVVLGVFGNREDAEGSFEEFRSDCETRFKEYEVEEWEVR